MALTHYNMWNKIKNKVSLGTNVTEVLSWVENGSCEVGIVYASDVINNDKVEVIEECQLDLSIVYPIAMLENIKNKEDVQKVFDEICSEESLNIYRKSGLKVMKLIKTTDAVGHVLCHDLTQIIKGVTKDARFRKGHIVTQEDIDVLLSMGKENLYVLEKDENMLHENEAAEVLCKLCINEYMKTSEMKEGKIELISEINGLLKIDTKKLMQINSLGEMMIATRHNNTVVKPNDKLAGMRVIPLLIEKEKMEKASQVTNHPILEIKPFVIKKAAIITTGSEVYKGRIQDTFTPVIRKKLAEYDIEVIYHEIVDDNDEMTTSAIVKAIELGAEFVICTGGMSVDPDDKTPLAIKNTKANIISYGAPVLPGAMFLLAYLNNVPIVGLPGCVMYARRTIFDIVLPRIIARDEITAFDLASLGEGGLCLNCDVCTYPNCGFGK